jgi:hypothetical protein
MRRVEMTEMPFLMEVTRYKMTDYKRNEDIRDMRIKSRKMGSKFGKNAEEFRSSFTNINQRLEHTRARQTDESSGRLTLREQGHAKNLIRDKEDEIICSKWKGE